MKFRNFAEEKGETWEICEERIKRAIKSALKVDVHIQRAHRVGKLDLKKHRSRPRDIVAKLTHWKDREAVWKRRGELKRAYNIGVLEDMCAGTMQVRQEKWPQLQKAWEDGKIA